MIKKIFSKLRRIFIRCCSLFFRLLPIKKKRIYFISNMGEKYACNTRALFEYLYQNHKEEFDFVYIANNNEIKELLPKDIKTAKYESLKDYFYYYTSKIIVNNFRFPQSYKKRKKQYYIQAWHGSTIPYKKIEKDVESSLNPNYVKMAKNDSKYIDCLIMGSTSCQEIFDNCFYCENKTVVTGTPRTDKLVLSDQDEIKSIKENLNLTENDYLVLYAPTFRDNMPIESGFLNNEKIKDAFKKLYPNKDIKILYRFHPNLAKKVKELTLPEGVINVTEYFDMQDLILISDIMITDFSSCAFDMMFAKKQTLIYTNDAKQYMEGERGLYISLKELPFLISSSEDELCEHIVKHKEYEPEFNKKVLIFSEKFGTKEDGLACKRIYDIIKKNI